MANHLYFVSSVHNTSLSCVKPSCCMPNITITAITTVLKLMVQGVGDYRQWNKAGKWSSKNLIVLFYVMFRFYVYHLWYTLYSGFRRCSDARGTIGFLVTTLTKAQGFIFNAFEKNIKTCFHVMVGKKQQLYPFIIKLATRSCTSKVCKKWCGLNSLWSHCRRLRVSLFYSRSPGLFHLCWQTLIVVSRHSCWPLCIDLQI